MASKELIDQKRINSKKNKNEADPSILWSNIILEPMWIGVTMSLSTGIFAYKNLFIQRACLVDLGYPEEVCFSSVDSTKAIIEMKAQKIVSSYMVVSTFVAGLITSIMFLFLGPWSDNSGRRKPLLLLPIVGMMISSFTLIVIQFFPKILTVWIIYAEVLPLAIGGNFTILLMSSMSYLGDICYKTGRCTTTIMGKNMLAISLCMMIGCIVSPLIYRNFGFVAVFSFCFVLESTSLIYVMWRVKDINEAHKVPNIFDLTLPLQVARSVFKKREGNKRKNVLLMIIVPSCGYMIDTTEILIYYLYLRKKFSWTELEFGYFMATKMFIFTSGTLIILTVFKKKLKLGDRLIGIISGISQICSSLLFMFSPNSWGIFGCNLLALFGRGAIIVERPVLNRQIEANEQGKINSFTAVLEKCTSLVCAPLVTFIYSKTLDQTFAIICIVCACIQMLCYVFVSEEKLVRDEIDMKNDENI